MALSSRDKARNKEVIEGLGENRTKKKKWLKELRLLLLKEDNGCPLFDDGLAIHCRGNDDQLFCRTTKRKKREKASVQRERFKQSSEKSLSGKKKKNRSENLKLLSTEGLDSGRRRGSVVLSPRDVELNWPCIPRPAVPPF